MLGLEEVYVMDLVIAISILTALALVTVLALLIRNVARSGKNLPVTSEWIDDLSIERYRPMLRMLDAGDIEFLRSQPGFTPEMATKLRIQRTQMFRGYLRSLESDFGRVCSAMKLVMLYSKHDRSDLAGIMFQQQIRFATGMLSVQFRLALYRWGLCNVDVTSLIKLFDGMRVELRTLVPSSMSMSA